MALHGSPTTTVVGFLVSLKGKTFVQKFPGYHCTRLLLPVRLPIFLPSSSTSPLAPLPTPARHSVYDVKRRGESTCKQITITGSTVGRHPRRLNCRAEYGGGLKKKMRVELAIMRGRRENRGTLPADNPAKFENVLRETRRTAVDPPRLLEKLMLLVPGNKFPPPRVFVSLAFGSTCSRLARFKRAMSYE